MKKPGEHVVVGPVVELPPANWPVTPSKGLLVFMRMSGLHAEQRRRPAPGPFEEFRLVTIRGRFPRRDRQRPR
ncbi:MAG: hypothetical protein IT435_14705 [Phycisphaerales bacterium]|nr:hypothetical protein [Phycisphaerales bacterium]